MLSSRSLMTFSKNIGPIHGGPSAPFLSVIILCRWPQDEAAVRMIATLLGLKQKEFECILLVEPIYPSETRPNDFISWCEQQGYRVITHCEDCGLRALRWNEGILASQGKWVWLVDAQNPVPQLKPYTVHGLLEPYGANQVPILVHPNNQSEFLVIPGVRPLWLDLLYKGWRFPFENIFFPRDLFNSQGLLDPHIVMSSFFQQEFLLRISRFIQFEKIDDPRGVGGKRDRFPAIFYYWLDTDRIRLLTPSHIFDYKIDDLEQFHLAIPEKERWQAYLNYILPYYYRYRHLLPDGFLNLPQSLPPQNKHFLCVKSDHYATTTDVTLRNFDVWAQGKHYYKLSYIASAQMESKRKIKDDAVLLLRTIETSTLNLAVKAVEEGLPIGYALDDDLLNISENYEAMASFRPGNPDYDAMVDTLRLVDTVICGGKHTEKAVQRVNPRTVQFDASVLPEFMPKFPIDRQPGNPFKFGYAGGSYRIDEMRLLWPAIDRIRHEYGDRVAFEFWGLDPTQFTENLEGISFVPFSISYYEYLERLKATGFQAMLIPLLSQPAHRRGKLPVKLWETAAAGAVGIYSNVPVYQVVKINKLGLMVEENTEAWYEAMRQVLDMPPEEYADLLARSIAYVQEFYTTPAVLPLHEHGLEAILFHGATRTVRNTDGRPSVLYIFPSSPNGWKSEPRFRRILDLAMKSGIDPEIIIPDCAQEFPEWALFREHLNSQKMKCMSLPAHEISARVLDENGVHSFLTKTPVALVHAFEKYPAIGALCAGLGIPYISAFSDFRNGDFRTGSQSESADWTCTLVQSGRMLCGEESEGFSPNPWVCVRDVIPEILFTNGFDRLYGRQLQPEVDHPIRIGIIGLIELDHPQQEILQTLSGLIKAGYPIQLDIFNDGTSPSDYYADCLQTIDCSELRHRILYGNNEQDTVDIYQDLDILVNFSIGDPDRGIAEAMASGILVVALKRGDLSELMNDGIDCILVTHLEPESLNKALERAMTLSPSESLRMRRRAFHLARQEFHLYRGMKDLLAMYNLALKIASSQLSTPQRESKWKESQYRQPARALQTPGSHLPIGRGLIYNIMPNRSDWMGLDVLIGLQKRPIKGILEMKVLSGGKVVREISKNLALVGDNDWVEFRFDPIANSYGRAFTLAFRLIDEGTRPDVRVYENNPPERAPLRLLRHVGWRTSGNLLYCRMQYARKE